MRKPNFLFLLIIFLILPVVAGTALVYSLFPEIHLPGDPLEKAKILSRDGDQIQAFRILQDHLTENPFNIEYHRFYLVVHHRLPENVNGRIVQNEEQIQSSFEEMCHSAVKKIADHGCYYLGLYYAHRDEYPAALRNFEKVSNKNQKYLNLSKGIAYSHLEEHRKALEFLYRELYLGNNDADTLLAISMSIASLKDWNRLEELMSNEKYATLIPDFLLQKYRLAKGNYEDYFRNYASLLLRSLNPFPILLSIIGLFTWAWMLRWWVPFDRFPWKRAVLMILSGMFVTPFATVFYDVLGLSWGPAFRGVIVYDLIYSIFFIGLLEESLKIFPVLLLSLFPGSIRRPSDWMVFGGASGLGFGILESFLYVLASGPSIAMSRFFVSVPLHILLSSMIGISLGEAKHRGISRTGALAFSLSGVAVLHGLFDFAILGPLPFLSLFAFYGIVFITILFLQGRSGILFLSQTEQSGNSRVASLTVFPFAGFALMVILVVLITGGNVDRHTLLTTTGIRIFYSLGAFYVVFFLSLRPAVREWTARWYLPSQGN